MIRPAVLGLCGWLLLVGEAGAQVVLAPINVASTGIAVPVALDDPPRASHDGRVVVFATDTPGLVPDDTNGTTDIFVRDLAAGTLTRVNVGPGGTQAIGRSMQPSISGDGRFVVFASDAINLLGASALPRCGPTASACTYIYLVDRDSGTVEAVTRAPNGALAAGNSWQPEISGNGRFVVYESASASLVAGDTNDVPDVFVWDRLTQTTERVSVSTDGAQASGATTDDRFGDGPSISDDGRHVAFTSTAMDLAPGGVNAHCLPLIDNCPDVYLHDRLQHVTTRVSVASNGERASHGATWGTISGDGRIVAFVSDSINLGGTAPSAPHEPSPRLGIPYVHDALSGRTRAAFTSTQPGHHVTEYLSVSADGRFVATDIRGLFVPDAGQTGGGVLLWDVSTGMVRDVVRTADGRRLDPASTYARWSFLSRDAHALVFARPNGARLDLFEMDPLDADHDTLPTEWETSLGLDAYSPASANGTTGDPDGDGIDNAAELAAGTHPRGTAGATRFFAEGAAGRFFSTRLTMLNPSTTPAHALVHLMHADGRMAAATVAVGASDTAVFTPTSADADGDSAFATWIESEVPLVVTREMSWAHGSGIGAHVEQAQSAPASSWYFAEGATSGGFNLFYLLANPGDASARIRVRYLRRDGAPLEKEYEVGPRSRVDIWVDTETFDGQALLADTEVAAIITVLEGPPILSERSMYLTPAEPGAPFGAGTAAAGAIAPALTWYLAEGRTGPTVDTFVLVANPSTSPARVEAEYLLPDGTRITRMHTVAPESRYTIWVDQDDARLADTAVATVLRSLDNVPVVVERSVWWGSAPGAWEEGHASGASPVTAVRWALAGSGPPPYSAPVDSYVLIANPGDVDAEVAVTLVGPSLNDRTRTFTVRAGSRLDIHLASEFRLAPWATSTLVESLTGTPIIVEQSIYRAAGNVRWSGGTNVMGTPVQP
jgi:hypothetical protein